MNIYPRANFTRAEVAASCRQFGHTVGPLPAGVDGSQLLWALCGVESSFGANCQPRHEPAYDVGGVYATHAPMPTWLSRYGSEGACSFGPLQLMLCNAPLIFGPSSFDNLSLAFQASIAHLNKGLRWFKPANLAEVGEIWNTGHITGDPEYVSKLTAAYKTEMPEEGK